MPTRTELLGGIMVAIGLRQRALKPLHRWAAVQMIRYGIIQYLKGTMYANRA
jgi:hypothetical protein